MTTRVRRFPVVELACALLLLGGCVSTEHRDQSPVVSAPPAQAPGPATEARAQDLAKRVAAKAKRSEKAEGKRNLVQDHVEVKKDAAGNPVVEQTGEASWYGRRHHGRKTASGARFDPKGLTAAHPALPLGTKATVTNLENGKSTDVTITDRGPYAKGRDIDVSKAAAEKIGAAKDGVVPVKIETQVTPEPGRSP